MSATLSSPHSSRDSRWRPEWRRALRALRGLLADPDSTGLALEITDALDRDRVEQGLVRLLATPEGRALYEQRPRLLERLADRAWLAGLPDGSLGRAYLDHIERNGLDPGKLVELRRQHDRPWDSHDAGLRWYLERSSLCHDLDHVLSGYGPDAAGETALLFYAHGQQRQRSTALLMAGAGLRTWSSLARGARPGWPLYLGRAWLRGRRARALAELPLESLLAEPLASVRARAGVEPPAQAHPRGLFVGGAGAPVGRVPGSRTP